MQGSGTHPLAIVAIVPARFSSTRFPGKPLVDLAGVPMVVRVAQQAQKARRVDRVRVATDDVRIRDVVTQAGFEAVMTPESCASGTDRVAFAARDLDDVALIVNVQGDEPLVDPADIDALIEETSAASAEIGTLARPLDPARFADPSAVKVVRDLHGQALYFSRSPMPHDAPELALLHLGLYAYQPSTLRAVAQLPPTVLERAERLEQLRWLEHGFNIHVAMARSTAPSYAIDTPEDVQRVLEVLESRADRGQRTANAPR